ncbi:hypothetical protein AZO1586I_626 [Bathymodiolus thermophilus thioautotrophic gill symbiont]|jgi:hypothetical protein|uniref:Uncharacterized protein n=3 Tax=sulfur-oxidizing symbionts TaxID=32036 RepID=A0ACA8ZMV5_9GAMM|nr:hypothetical protein [Bathymodiolus azoricus thioautotrophic gill symbiont]CAB5500275.1 hypothetical protein AZO1586I_626 [Bathymodiolus thermophilus thioautotrophic gill symbiont]CAC9512077.1 hypothetical protein [uncultured Gammaproteobacteria bacterium]CAB5495120.1 hypothetical protein AZO1586R_185 [Bathymodiolus azoricus thioautotrophic gill symbiont]CAC9516472.1 hypothetical protein [uncultured Gammaproteobacteria bacterium]CAC9528714.1 hypothetical protein [uncultured Gammaproteobacte
MNTQNMKKYLKNLIDEKGIDTNLAFKVKGETGINLIPIGVVIEHILLAPIKEKRAIKDWLVKIDFVNGNVLDYFKHLAQAIAK